MSTHHYATSLSWEGSTGLGYDRYDRGHTARVAPVDTTIHLTADPAFGGDPTRLNPEQLLVLAASSCQMLSFLAAAARARIDVIAYEDDAVGEMPDDDRPVRITRITLRPRITIRSDVSDARVQHLVEVGHRECYIANSVTTAIAIDAEILRVRD